MDAEATLSLVPDGGVGLTSCLPAEGPRCSHLCPSSSAFLATVATSPGPPAQPLPACLHLPPQIPAQPGPAPPALGTSHSFPVTPGHGAVSPGDTRGTWSMSVAKHSLLRLPQRGTAWALDAAVNRTHAETQGVTGRRYVGWGQVRQGCPAVREGLSGGDIRLRLGDDVETGCTGRRDPGGGSSCARALRWEGLGGLRLSEGLRGQCGQSRVGEGREGWPGRDNSRATPGAVNFLGTTFRR